MTNFQGLASQPLSAACRTGTGTGRSISSCAPYLKSGLAPIARLSRRADDGPVHRRLPAWSMRGTRCSRERTHARFDEETYSFYEEYLALEEGTAALENSRFKMGRSPGDFSQVSGNSCGRGKGYRAVKARWSAHLPSFRTQGPGRPRSSIRRALRGYRAEASRLKARWQIERLKAFGVRDRFPG